MNDMYQFIVKNNPEEAQRYYIVRFPTPIESFSFNSNDLSILLRYLHDKLGTLEQSQLTTAQFPYQSYAEARVFLKAFFVFFRILPDDLAAIIKYFYKKNEGTSFTGKLSFDKLIKKAENEKSPLPADLCQLLEPTFLWFPERKKPETAWYIFLTHFYSLLSKALAKRVPSGILAPRDRIPILRLRKTPESISVFS